MDPGLEHREMAGGLLAGLVATWESMTGRVRETIFTIVIERRSGEWKISAAQNSNVAPPRHG